MTMRVAIGLFGMVSSALAGTSAFATPSFPSTGHLLTSIALSAPFGAHPGWQLKVTQDGTVADPFGEPSDTVPGAIRLCLSSDNGRTCRPGLDRMLTSSGPGDLFTQPHFLNDARIVQPTPGRALLLIQVASLHGGNGDQRVATIALRYDRARDRFVPAYARQTRRNNNQEIRYVAAGPLRGAIIAAEPTDDAPFGFWMTVDRPDPTNAYRQVLRYRSATRYGDGNALAVIDSEMPEIQRRLALWHPGSPLPLPAGGCTHPRLIAHALWCSPNPVPHIPG